MKTQQNVMITVKGVQISDINVHKYKKSIERVNMLEFTLCQVAFCCQYVFIYLCCVRYLLSWLKLLETGNWDKKENTVKYPKGQFLFRHLE